MFRKNKYVQNPNMNMWKMLEILVIALGFRVW